MSDENDKPQPKPKPEPGMLKAYKLELGEFSVGLTSEAPDSIILVLRDQVALMMDYDVALALHDAICIHLGIMEEGENPNTEVPTEKSKWN